MKKYLTNIFAAVAILLSDVMCALVAYTYRDMLCADKHMGHSAPATLAFIYVIPFLAAIAACVLLALVFRQKKGD